MATSSGTYSGSSQIQNSGSEEVGLVLIDQRKRKRMISNRESARRSRMRKQQHLEDLTTQVDQLKTDNSQVLSTMNVTEQLYSKIEAENCVLRAQLAELTHRLESLNEINRVLVGTNNGVFDDPLTQFQTQTQFFDDGFMMNPWNSGFMNQPIMASAEMFMY